MSLRRWYAAASPTFQLSPATRRSRAQPLTPRPDTQDGMEIRYPGMVDEGKLTQTPLGRALERKRAEIQPKKFANLTKAKVSPARSSPARQLASSPARQLASSPARQPRVEQQ